MAWGEDETGAQLKGILSEAVLTVTSGASAGTSSGIIAAEDMEDVRGLECSSFVGGLIGVNEEGKGDANLFAKKGSVARIAEADGSKRGSSLLEALFVCTQLRDGLAAENSTVVTKEDNGRGSAFPERAETDAAASRFGRNETGKPGADGVGHESRV
jgi:hypothetical protein